MAFRIIALLQTFVPCSGIHHCAYLSIGVTSSSGVGLCGMSGGVILGVPGRGYARSCIKPRNTSARWPWAAPIHARGSKYYLWLDGYA